MSGVDLIIGALAAGSAAGITTAASDAVRDACIAFKTLLARRLAGRAEARAALDTQETDPAAWKARLGGDLTESGATEDEQVLAAARRLLNLLDDEPRKYHVDLHMAKGVQVGNGNTQNNYFS